MKKTLSSVMILSSLSMGSMSSYAGAMDTENFSASIALTSNYLFRGITLSDDHPAVSGSLDWGYNGFYAGIWGSSLEPVDTESMELDYYAGYAGESGSFSYSLDFLYYDYPGADADLDYIEFGGSLAYTLDGDYAPTVGVSVLYSPDFYAETGDAVAIESSLGFSLPADYGLSFHYGVQELDDEYYDPDSYDYYGVDLSKTFGKFDFTIGYSDTNSDGEAFQGSNTSELYFTVGAAM